MASKLSLIRCWTPERQAPSADPTAPRMWRLLDRQQATVLLDQRVHRPGQLLAEAHELGQIDGPALLHRRRLSRIQIVWRSEVRSRWPPRRRRWRRWPRRAARAVAEALAPVEESAAPESASRAVPARGASESPRMPSREPPPSNHARSLPRPAMGLPRPRTPGAHRIRPHRRVPARRPTARLPRRPTSRTAMTTVAGMTATAPARTPHRGARSRSARAQARCSLSSSSPSVFATSWSKALIVAADRSAIPSRPPTGVSIVDRWSLRQGSRSRSQPPRWGCAPRAPPWLRVRVPWRRPFRRTPTRSPPRDPSACRRER